MHVLTLLCSAAPSSRRRSLLQEVATVPPPDVPGLHARHWRQERQIVRGRYLFDERRSLAAFTRHTAVDPAVARMAQELPTVQFDVQCVEEIPSTEIFDRPVFILSAPRAGSTLLFELLSRSGQLWTADSETQGVIEGIPHLNLANRGFDSHRLIATDADSQTTTVVRAGFVAELRNHAGRRYLEHSPEERPSSIRFLEKTPEHVLRLPFLAAAFPKARFIFLHRDARQNISSLVESWHHDGFISISDLPGWPRRQWCFLLPPGWRRLGDASISDVAAFQWRAANEIVLDDLAALPHERWTVVEYEVLVNSPEATVRRLCDFMEIDFDTPLAAAVSRPLPLSSTTITAPSPIKWRSNRKLQHSSLASLGPLKGRLRNLTSHAESVPPSVGERAPVRFSCFVEQIPPLSPMALVNSVVVNPSFQFQLGPTVPLALLRRTPYRARFLADYPLLWIEDPATQVLQPFWVRRNLARLFMSFRAGQPPPSLDAGLTAQLASAGVLVNAQEFQRRREFGETRVECVNQQLARDRYCELPSLIDPAHTSALAQYYRSLIDSGFWTLGDGQVDRRHGWHNEPLARFYHHQLTVLVGRIAGEPVKPTYSYSSAYRGGAALRPHTDRRQCEFTMSLLIDQSANAAQTPWPLWFQTSGGKASVTLAPGDAVLFRGCELPHWREAAPADQFTTTLLFHYVPIDFVGVLD